MCVSIYLMRDSAQEKVDRAKPYKLCAGSFSLDDHKVVSNCFQTGQKFPYSHLSRDKSYMAEK